VYTLGKNKEDISFSEFFAMFLMKMTLAQLVCIELSTKLQILLSVPPQSSAVLQLWSWWCDIEFSKRVSSFFDKFNDTISIKDVR